jgi:hypothetical protein
MQHVERPAPQMLKKKKKKKKKRRAKWPFTKTLRLVERKG